MDKFAPRKTSEKKQVIHKRYIKAIYNSKSNLKEFDTSLKDLNTQKFFFEPGLKKSLITILQKKITSKKFNSQNSNSSILGMHEVELNDIAEERKST